MRPPISPTNMSPVIDKNFTAISNVINGGLSFDNMNIFVISGTTKGVDEENKVYHNISPQPIGWFPLVGDVYVQSITNQFIDVRSTKANVPFKIILVMGSPVTGSDISAAGVSTPIILENLITMTPTAIASTTLGMPTNAGVAGSGGYNCVVTDGSYFYCTAASGSLDRVYRISRSTGLADSLQMVNTQELAGMVIQGTDLWVTPRLFNNGTAPTSQQVTQIDLNTFTITTTHTGTSSSNTDGIAHLYVDGTSIYTGGGNGTLTTSWLTKWARGGGAVSHLNLATASSSPKAKRILPSDDGVSLFVVNSNLTTATVDVYKVTKATYAVAATYNSASMKLDCNMGLLNNGLLYMPVSYNTNKGVASAASYGQGLMVLDTNSGIFSFYPLAGLLGGANAGFIRNAVLDNDGFLYLVTSGADSSANAGTTIIRFDTYDNTHTIGWFPFNIGGAGNTAVTGGAQSNILVKDTDGSLIVAQNNAANTFGNFNFFQPDFSAF